MFLSGTAQKLIKEKLMVEKEFRITNPSGLHTRPGNDFVKTAKQFSCAITLTKGNKTVDGKSLLKLMKANVVQGDVLTISCSGEDESDALAALENYLLSLTE
jgi:phosphotransferase system HPr (HPr) family protein